MLLFFSIDNNNGRFFCRPKLEILEPLLKAMLESGLGISQSVVQTIQEGAGEEMTESIAQLLVELGSGKVTPTDLLRFPSSGNRTIYKRTQKFVELAKEHNLEEALKEKDVCFFKNPFFL